MYVGSLGTVMLESYIDYGDYIFSYGYLNEDEDSTYKKGNTNSEEALKKDKEAHEKDAFLTGLYHKLKRGVWWTRDKLAGLLEKLNNWSYNIQQRLRSDIVDEKKRGIWWHIKDKISSLIELVSRKLHDVIQKNRGNIEDRRKSITNQMTDSQKKAEEIAKIVKKYNDTTKDIKDAGDKALQALDKYNKANTYDPKTDTGETPSKEDSDNTTDALNKVSKKFAGNEPPDHIKNKEKLDEFLSDPDSTFVL